MRRLPRPPLGPPGMGPPPGHIGPGPIRPVRGPLPPPPRPMGMGMGMPPPPIMPPAVGSVTNSTDPASMNARLFVGNVNTVALTKEDVEGIFSVYGLVRGVSVHKGYAFVQFNNPEEARCAKFNENGKVYLGQALDINLVSQSQPKSRNAQKRTTTASSDNDTSSKKARDDSSPGTNQSLQRTLVTLSTIATETAKKSTSNNGVKPVSVSKNTINESSSVVKTSAQTDTKLTPNSSHASKVVVSTASVPSPSPNTVSKTSRLASGSDILICGKCKMQFVSLNSLIQHKKIPCRLRFTCQCQDKADDEPNDLQCASCDAEFSSAWALCLHNATEHQLSIFRTGGHDTPSSNLTDIKKETSTSAE